MESNVYVNNRRTPGKLEGPAPSAAAEVLAFHQTLPHYKETPLHSLPAIAKELQLGHVLVKDESNRFDLPSFKILGASWAVFRAVTDNIGLSPNDDGLGWQQVGSRASAAGISLVTCTEGNWGRAVARMAKYLDLPVEIFVPSFMPETTRVRIRSEGAHLRIVDGSYDDSVSYARQEAEAKDKAILVMDMGWEGYEQIPEWVVEGYSTMLRETDAQLHTTTRQPQPAITHAFIPVGVGSIAHAVTQHYKAATPAATVVTVEPTTAACLRASLEHDRLISVQTGDSIMCGMNCGTVSSTAWPTLRSGVDADITVAEDEAHAAVGELEALGLMPGPCGAATLAALRRGCREAREELGFTRESVVVLFCTEGRREYVAPT